ncbi:uncharacterized protein [Drosophila virilis]|uniref:Uncharacterized protein, isoform A n=1 Tax=Drosophila virilis TaxID=7244 RepID=B4LWV3_DROVI|nr:uncharacterized protein LOC6629420 [Drosophila virilis]EDW66674.1 uncharacterized protein Dvir_GJ23728, isoform A [Drosophila virilis]
MQKQEEITTRLKKIFDLFLRDNFSTTDSVYFEKLITHLQAKENAFVLQAPFVTDWVNKCLTLISDDFHKVHPKVISFMLNLISFMTSNEWMVLRLRELDIMHRVVFFMQAQERNFSPSIKLSGIRVMKAVTKYSMGLAFLQLQRSWTLLIHYSNNEHTLYVVREARQLLYEMLYKFCDKMHDEAVTLEILSEIMKPIHDNVYITDNISDNTSGEEERIHVSVDDNELLHKISSTVDLLSYILQQTLVSEERTKIVSLLREHHNLDLNIWKLVEMTHNTYYIEKMLSTLCSYHFATLVHEKILNPDCVEPPEQFTEFGLSFFNLMKFCIQRSDGITFIKMAELHHILWKKLGTRVPKEIVIQDQRVSFENQLICFHMMPLLFSMKFAMKMADESKSELFDTYIMKLLEMSCEQTLRLCYSLRDAFITPEGHTNGGLFTPELARKCVHSILSLEHVLDREQAVTVCQALLYALREVVAFNHSSNHNEPEDCHGASTSSNYSDIYPRGSEAIIKDPKVLHSVMVGLRTLIERFKITWKESVETIGLVNCLAFVLENCNLDPTCTVEALKLVQLAVEHFLSPNMALLVDNLQGSALVCLGPIIVKRMHDTAWEVRDSALELTTSIACISRIKFPAFQQFLIDGKMPPIVYEMAKHDSEPYVRASAYKCLSKMVPINALWENGLSQLDLVDHLLYVLYRENDDIVRAEAILTLSKIYDHRKIPCKYKNTLFSTLNYCVVGDHHWEVKVNALCFWRMEFNRQFNNQGMIDGAFPTVTFSKEHKKIVTLTGREVKLRVAKVLAEVQQYGYYGIILKCLREEYSKEVLKLIVTGIKAMNDKVNEYDFEIILNNIETLTPPVQSSNCNFPFTPEEPMSVEPVVDDAAVNAEQADDVIESILNAQDVQLLENTFKTQMHINNEDTEKRHIDEFYYKQFAVSVREWKEEIGKFDLDKLVKQQDEWFDCNDNLVCLLDDILNAIKRDDNMISDCY